MEIMEMLETAVIPTDAVCKTVSVHESLDEIEMLVLKMHNNRKTDTTIDDLHLQRMAWYQGKGYSSRNDIAIGAYGPYRHEFTVTRFWKSKQDAEDWMKLTRQLYQACDIADNEVHVELVEI